MKKAFLTGLIAISAFYSYSSSNSAGKDPQASQQLVSLPAIDIKISVTDYLKLTPRSYKKITGKKLTLKEIILLKISQRQIKKHIRNNDSIHLVVFEKKPKEKFKWHWGGFFLGMWFPFGLIIAASINDEKRKDRLRSSLFGVAAVLLITILIVILIAPIGI